MTILHAHFLLRSQQAFQHLLTDKGQPPSGPSTSAGKSWNKTSQLTSINVNTRDSLGRTVLHLACSDIDRIEYVKILLRHPAINVNIQDEESHWTPLHRALYNANLPAALLLLQRSDIDTSLKDYEGYTAFDLYNSTLEETAPQDGPQTELYTWGTNRNATLGLGDGEDRSFPEPVVIPSQEDPERLENLSLKDRFLPAAVRQVEMARLHTVAVASESQSNLRVCGFGGSGRLGTAQHMQYTFKPLSIAASIISVALGQDHTLALTSTGEVLSWGLNRFSQLGYVVESSPGVPLARSETPIQSTPRKIHGPLKKEVVCGVAASKMSSACWTATEVFSWGSNQGQLGYDKVAQPVQILPRKVTKVTKPVISIALTDSVMACLLDTQDVICIWNDRSFKINFPSHGFPSEIQPYRPPQALKAANIARIACGDDLFAALSHNGELFTFTVPTATDSDQLALTKSFKPQRVWALRKQFSAVKDVAIGSEGSIIVCTKSGHVFVRSRTVPVSKSAGSSATSVKAFKFQRIPFIQRVVKVRANGTGAFGALRIDYKPPPIAVVGNDMAKDFAQIRPYVKRPPHSIDARVLSELIWDSNAKQTLLPGSAGGEGDEEGLDSSVEYDFKGLQQLCAVLEYLKAQSKNVDSRQPFFCHGADILVTVAHSTYAFPAHRVILAARSTILQQVIYNSIGTKGVKDSESNVLMRFIPSQMSGTPHLQFTSCQPMAVLILLDYVYTDQALAIWDSRLSMLMSKAFRALNISVSKVKSDLEALARILGLSALLSVLPSPSKRVPRPTLAKDMAQLHVQAQNYNSFRKAVPPPDVVLRLADKDVYTYSVILRSRTDLFAGLFNEPDWTMHRWNQDGILVVNLNHLKWHSMEYVLRFMCCGEGGEMFEALGFVNSVDDILDFIFEVLAAANELLLDKLVLLCSEVALRFSDIRNICSVLADASHFHALPLVQSVQAYMAVSLETLLESRLLDALPADLVKQLSTFIAEKQKGKAQVTRSSLLLDRAMETYGDWLALQDIPQVIVPSNRAQRDSSKLSPAETTPRRPRQSLGGPSSLPSSPPVASSSQDDLFSMDDVDATPASAGPSMVWKASVTPQKVDMRAVMAEAASVAERTTVPVRASPSSGDDLFDSLKARSKRPMRPVTDLFEASASPQSRAGTTPWKPVSGKDTASGPESPFPKLSAPPPSLQGQRSPSHPSLGPIFSPMRSSSSNTSPGSVRRVSSTGSNAWSTPTMNSSPPSMSSGMSFAAIQQQQLEQATPVVKGKQSLVEIQQQEQDRRTEEEFLKWWAVEEERMRLEANAAHVPKSRKPKRRSDVHAGKPKPNNTQKTSTS